MKKVAAIDIGTNTALLLIAGWDGREIHPVAQKEEIVRLGEGVDETRLLSKAAIARTLAAIDGHVRLAREFSCETVLISGTSAVRAAGNRDTLLNAIRTEFGLSMRVLSGREEARLTYLGALSNKRSLGGGILLVDIGGGSTEFICGKQEEINFEMSLDIGSVRLTERFVQEDPISQLEFGVLQDFIRSQLQALNAQQIISAHFVGVAGTVTTLAAVHFKAGNYDAARIDNSVLTIRDVEILVQSLKSKTLAQRKRLPGLNPKRADVILAGGLILQEVMREFNRDNVIVSDRGLRFGLILDEFQNK